ncbi:hypothetical protein CXU13_04490 [Akkermansia muciniphila]|nr:hypothetical protein CXU12_09470 [Akkermansia muciniphila]PNC59976.1 hypothetical protein CXU13_04490 [Akkermansia muciniphila]
MLQTSNQILLFPIHFFKMPSIFIKPKALFFIKRCDWWAIRLEKQIPYPFIFSVFPFLWPQNRIIQMIFIIPYIQTDLLSQQMK